MASKRKTGAQHAARKPSPAKPQASSLATTQVGSDRWRHDNIGRLLNNAVRRFEGRVLDLMARAGHEGARISHVNLTRSLDREGTRITELAARAGMTKQAMGELVDQCVGIGLVERVTDSVDKRARIVRFTRPGLEWLDAFRKAVDQAEQEMRAELGMTRHDAVRNALKIYESGRDTLA
jgi:DNA-binding MarR family transcriptional regulator